ncbi:MAG: amino acid permease [Candidatus Eisenbacteria bacterium]|nr:amino acid permease [Candidatus Eisenbacteria bacterium]
MSPAAGHEPRTAGLRRAMGQRDVVMFLVVAVVGTRWIATAAAVGPSALVIWLIGFLALFVPLAFTVVELSSRYPQEGGLYVWTRRAFGEYPGFLTGWMYWSSNLTYFPGLLYFSAASALFMFGPAAHALSTSIPYFVIASLAGLAVALGMNIVGLDVGKWLHNAGAIGTWIPVALLIGAGFVVCARFGSATSFTRASLIPGAHLQDLVLWSTIAFAFGGIESASFMSEEIRDPGRSIPRAIVIAGAMITAIYVLGTLAVLLALPKSEVTGLEGIMQATTRAAERIGARGVGPVAALLTTIGGLGGVGAWLASNGRLTFVAGVDRYLPAAFGKLHPRWGTPHVALLAQGAGAALFAVWGQAGTGVKGAYDALVAMTVIAYFVPLLFLFAAMIALQRESAGPGVIRVPGGRPVAIAMGGLGFATTAISMVLAALPPADEKHPAFSVAKVIGGTLILIAIGTAMYARGRRTRWAGTPGTAI